MTTYIYGRDFKVESVTVAKMLFLFLFFFFFLLEITEATIALMPQFFFSFKLYLLMCHLLML